MSDPGVGTASLRRPIPLARRASRHALAADVPFVSGAIAYQAFVSLMPLLFLLVVAATALGGGDLTGRHLDITVGQFPSDVRDLVREGVRRAVNNRGNSVVGVAVLGFGAFAVFNGFDKACIGLYGIERGSSFPIRSATRASRSARSVSRCL